LWDDQSIPDADLEACRAVELTKDAITYLKSLFEAYKADNNRIDLLGLDRIFATTEKGIPWKVKLETVYDNGISFDIWVGLWQKYLSINIKEAFKNLVYIGYCGTMKDAITLKRFKAIDLLQL
jgi:hypothetical protein